jgi:DNA repair protein RecO (recombination protein O)
MELKRLEGVILGNLLFEEKDRICTLFSKEEGLIKFLARNTQSTKSAYRALTDPLSKGEFVLKKGRGELFLFREGKLLEAHLSLRNDYSVLDAACSMGKALLSGLAQQQPAPKLYELFCYFLMRLPASSYPETLSLAFKLRLLRHEGLLSLKALPFQPTETEYKQLEILAYNPGFQSIADLAIEPNLMEKIEDFWNRSLL